MSFSEVTEPLWLQFFGTLEKDFRDTVPEDWRAHPVVNSACEFAALVPLQKEAEYLVGRYPQFDRLIAANPPTAIHHLYHLTRWSDETGVDIRSLRNVVEWGGGYGSLARLLLLLNPDVRYTVIDHPVMLKLHEHFLPSDRVRRVPVDLADGVGNGCDLFISTWALSESGEGPQDYVAEQRNWFTASHLLLAFNQGGFEASEHFNALVKDLPQFPAITEESRYVFT